MDLAWGIESTCNVIDRETLCIGYTQGLTRIKITLIAIFKQDHQPRRIFYWDN